MNYRNYEDEWTQLYGHLGGVLDRRTEYVNTKKALISHFRHPKQKTFSQ